MPQIATPDSEATPPTDHVFDMMRAAPEDIRSQILRECRSQWEPQLIEREARLIPVLMNLINYARPWRKDSDPRSTAAIKATLWRVFSPGTALAAGGVFTLLVSIATLILLSQQNEKLDQQTYVADAGRSASLISELGSVMGAVMAYANEVCTAPAKGGARRCWSDYQVPFRSDFVDGYKVNEASGQNTPSGRPIDFYASQIASTSDPDRQRPPLLPLAPQIAGRLWVLVSALRPYRYVEFPDVNAIPPRIQSGWIETALSTLRSSLDTDRPTIAPHPLSPERGQILASLVQLGVNLESGIAYNLSWEYAYIESPKFADIWLRHRNLANASLKCGDFTGANLQFSSFRHANLHGAQFIGERTSLVGVNFQGADLSRAKFLGVRLPRARTFESADLHEVDLHEATTTESSFLEQLAIKARHFQKNAWRLVPIEESLVAANASPVPLPKLYRLEHVSGQQLGLTPKACR